MSYYTGSSSTYRAQFPLLSPQTIVRAEQMDPWTVLVVDEAGMVGSRKLTRLLEHA
jgi:hypothetical protein